MFELNLNKEEKFYMKILFLIVCIISIISSHSIFEVILKIIAIGIIIYIIFYTIEEFKKLKL